MRKASVLAALAMLVCAGAAFAQATLPALLAAAIAETAAAARPVAYEVAVDHPRGAYRYLFDPAASGAQRVRLLAPAESELDGRTREALQRVRAEADGDIWCASRKLATARDVRAIAEDESSITYAFTPSPELAGGERGASVLRHVRGEMRVLKVSRDVAEVRIYAPAMFRLAIARIDQFDMRIRCDAAPNGRRYSAETATRVRGSALGQAFDERSTQRVTLRPG